MASSTLTSRGQVTVPKEIRDRLGLEQGDELRFELLPNGEVRVTTVHSRPSTFGAPGRLTRARPIDAEAMDDAIGRYLSEKHQ